MRLLAALALMVAVPASAQVSPLAWPDFDQTQYVTPATGATVVVTGGKTALLIDSGALLAALTVTLPGAPVDGQRFTISTSNGVTLLTINGGTVKGTITTLAANGWARYVYSTSATAWFRGG